MKHLDLYVACINLPARLKLLLCVWGELIVMYCAYGEDALAAGHCAYCIWQRQLTREGPDLIIQNCVAQELELGAIMRTHLWGTG